MALTKEQMAVLKENNIHLTKEDTEQINALTSNGRLNDEVLDKVGGGFKVSHNVKMAMAALGLIALGVGGGYVVHEYAGSKTSNSEGQEGQEGEEGEEGEELKSPVE